MKNQQNKWLPKTDFGAPPPNYVAGQGRGAQGFITRSDIGPAKLNEPVRKENEGEEYNEDKFDDWNGYSIPLFNVGDYDNEDKEADQLYEAIDEHLESRRKKRKESYIKQELKRIQSERPSFAAQVADLKRDSAKISIDQWLSIPEIGDYTIKKAKRDKYTPVPDTLIESAIKDIKNNVSLNEIGEARGTLLSLKLDKMGDGVSGQSMVDRKGYLTDLASLPMASQNEIGDFKKARLLLKSVIQANPKNSFGWLAAARIEELDGKLQTARNILAQALQTVEDAEDIWIESARLETEAKSRQILAKAISVMPNSVKIWLAAVNKEGDRVMKCKVLKRALEYIPNSELLWKELIELSSESEAKVLLHRAVECIPTKLEFWLALAKLENYENAKQVLNKARQYLPQEPSVWIHAAKLEESAGKEKNVIALILQKALKVLEKNGVRIVREDWLAEAELAEKSENYQTCYALVQASVGYGIADDQRKSIWVADADHFEARESIFTARAIYTHATEVLKEDILDERIAFEQRHSSKRVPLKEKPESLGEYWFLDEVLELAVTVCPQEERFWIRIVERNWDIGFVERTAEWLAKAKEMLPSSERVLVLESKIEVRKGNFEQAERILQEAKASCAGLKTWVQLIKLLIMRDDLPQADDVSKQACQQFQNHDKVWILRAKVVIKTGTIHDARAVYEEAVRLIPSSIKLWLNYVELECTHGHFQRARPLLDKARQLNPKQPQLWAASVRLEIDAHTKKGAVFMLSKALQECPRNGELWALAIELEPKNTRKKKSADAVSACVDDPYVYLSTAKIFWKEHKLEKAQRWLEKALLLNPRLGDAWGYLYGLLKERGADCQELLKKCLDKKPKDGRLWNKVKKSEQGMRMHYDQVLEAISLAVIKEIKQIE